MPFLAAFAIAAPEMLAVEAAAVTAAEVAAAEAAAAAAAEAAAASAAQQAAATTAAEAAATTAAQQAAMSGAPQAAGIMEVGGATANAPFTAEAVQAAAQQANAGISGLPQGFDQQLQNIQNMSQGPSVQVASTNPTAGLESLQNQPVFQSGQNLPSAVTSPVSGIHTVPDFQGVTSGPQGASPGFFNSTQAPGQGPLQYQLNAPNANQGMRLDSSLGSMTAPTTPMTSVLPPPSALEVGMDKAVKFAKANPFTAMTGAYMGASALGLMDPSGATFNDKKYDGPLSRYRLSPDFKPGGANPADFQYTPIRYATGGGIMGADPYTIPVGYPETNDVQGYAKGGSLSDSITQYQKMLDGKPQAAPARSADVGIYYDQDPDTRYQDALTAAQIRQAKVNQRAYVSPPAAKRPTPMGQLQMASVKPKKRGEDVEAARGGIMQSYFEGGVTGDGNLNLQMEVPAVQNYQDVIRGRSNMLQDAQYRPERDNPRIAANQGGMDLYDQYVAGNNRRLAEKSQVGSAASMMHDYVGPTMSRSMFEAGLNAPKNPASYFAQGGITSLGGYAAGGNPRLLKGPGDGMSDNIPATINGRQPARLADGEFVIPADVVSHLGNGSTEAGAKQLHAMMDRVRKARTGNKKQGKQIVAAKYLPKKKSA
jgi:hypothetical protein